MSNPELDELLISSILKHASADNKWAEVAKELTSLTGEEKTTQWCKNRAKKDAIKDRLAQMQTGEGPTSAGTSTIEVEPWRANLGKSKVVDMDGKGSGVLATSNLKMGDLICEEVPALNYRHPAGLTLSEFCSKEIMGPIADQFEALSKEKQEAVMSLSDFTVEGCKSLPGILRTNALGRGTDADYSIICPNVARFNHSCKPNCDKSWDENAGMMRVFVCRDVKAGEELCFPYIDISQPRCERQATLQERYGFTCSCEACSSPDSKSDLRRAKITELDAKVFQVGGSNPKQGVALVRELLDQYDQEGIDLLVLRARACYDAFQLNLLMKDLRGARIWIEKAHKFRSLAEGPNHPTTQQMHKYLQDPKSHNLWR
eukprot:TRINITY_DN37750_c0_g1_i1.p1 TRINITY_DN37750_c0_g1~~TRINITY_DN37750_c0_g1_i1.p1  ORF type:complete len:373 (+),score=51.18 TRINITY_DN37750_c0_g1_i1:102-1220(+)